MSATEPTSKFNEIFLSSSPHFTKGDTTQRIMLTVLIAMLPECVYGVYLFGLRAFITILASVTGCIVFEYLFQKATKQKVAVKNLSAAVTGVLIALVLPSTVPTWMVLVGDAVAIVIAKGLFGGLGSNVFNPALTGRGFMFLSFGGAMSAWFDPATEVSKMNWLLTGPSNADAVSSATVLSKIKAGSFVADSDAIWQYFFGNRAGCIGEGSIALILLSFVFLLVTGIIDWRAPLAMVATCAVCTFCSTSFDATQTIFALCTGGLIFGATFMATDYATTPVTKPGRLVFGAGCGLITFLIRRFGGYPEGVMFSILIMNFVTPFLNKLTSRKYGYGKKAAVYTGGAK
ncbi:MAG: RnfABCDGE type electron transport complex subunit D [Treponema sp.]|nr:RnfABCDGE type electron transport complex subunit D [Treponema sp.]MBR0125385.1 RnfABCDGE type electron transport complex subunit D [Treponema sp.]MBR0475518.1 RnfABCDGE type electron transport complex subunit D [Treponema sp.]